MPRILAGALACALATSAVGPTQAAIYPTQVAPSRTIFVPKDKSLAFGLDSPASKIVVAQPDTAQIVATTDHSFYVLGKALGTTNLLVYGPGGQLKDLIDVRVGYDPATLQQDLATAFPDEHIRVLNLGEGLLLQGEVSTTGVATRAKAIADKYAPNAVTSQLIVRASQQVVLQVRVLEASRSALQDIGVSGQIANNHFSAAFGSGLIGNTAPGGVIQLHGGAGSTSIDVALAALEQKGLVRTLARPNLVALSGEKASFLAGGEFPYPVPQGLNEVTLEFRQYGVKLNFEPTVEDNGLIRLQVAPEVSQLDATNSLRINGVTVPGLITRRADTTVEMKSGDSLAIGGLFQHDYSNSIRQFPVLGRLPVLGALFRSSNWNRNETELVIIVTPRLATEADFEAAAHAPPPEGAEPSAIDLILNGKTSVAPPAAVERR